MSTALRGLKGYSYCKLWKFFCSHLWPACFAPGHKSKEKNLVITSQYKPQTRQQL